MIFNHGWTRMNTDKKTTEETMLCPNCGKGMAEEPKF